MHRIAHFLWKKGLQVSGEAFGACLPVFDGRRNPSGRGHRRRGVYRPRHGRRDRRDRRGGDNVTLYQGAVLGGRGTAKGKGHPTIGNNVVIAAGAKVLGSFTVGDNSKIGAGAVVLNDVPPNCTVVGVPGRIVREQGRRVDVIDLDHANLPDPIERTLAPWKGASRPSRPACGSSRRRSKRKPKRQPRDDVNRRIVTDSHAAGPCGTEAEGVER